MTTTQASSKGMENRSNVRRDILINIFTRPEKPYGLALLYLVALTTAELVTVLSSPQFGALIHLLLLFLLMLHTAVTWNRPVHRFLLSLTFVPLIRTISLSLPLTGFPILFWYLITSVPLFAASYVASRQLEVPMFDRESRLRGLPFQILVGLTGIFLGFIEYVILRPAPLLQDQHDLGSFLIATIILLISTGLLEELIFRRLMQTTAINSLGTLPGILYVSSLFAVLHIGYNSLLDIVFVFIVGLFFAIFVYLTRSIIGVTIAHGLTNITLLLVLPLLSLGDFQFPETGIGLRSWTDRINPVLKDELEQLPTRVQPLTPAPSTSEDEVSRSFNSWATLELPENQERPDIERYSIVKNNLDNLKTLTRNSWKSSANSNVAGLLGVAKEPNIYIQTMLLTGRKRIFNFCQFQIEMGI